MWTLRRNLALSGVLAALMIATVLTGLTAPTRADWIPNATLTVLPNTVYIGVSTTFTYSLYNDKTSSVDVSNVSVHFDWQPSGWVYFLISNTVTLPAKTTHDFTLFIDIPQVATGEHLQSISIVGQANGDWWSSTLSQDDTFNVVQVPTLTVSLTANPSSGTTPLLVTLTASPQGGLTPYASFDWVFGDGADANTATTSTTHSYGTAGTFTATVTVTDSNSHQATATASITATTPLSISASADKTTGQGKLVVQFTSSASGGNAPYSYAWTFGDGSSSAEASPSHTYSTPGTYTATLVVTDSQSRIKTYEVTITVISAKSSSLPLYVGIGSAILVVAALGVFFLVRKGKKGSPPAV